MSITCDFHMHSSHSGDCESPMEEMILSAIDKGLNTICFTEHNDFDFPDIEELPKDPFILNVDAYLYDLLLLKEKYQEKINVLFGIEIGLQKKCLKKNLILSKAYDYDFIIASSHLCMEDDPYYPSFYNKGNDSSIYINAYFEEMLENVKSFQNYDVYGHLDYIARYIPESMKQFSYLDYTDIIDEILKIIIDNEKGIECNSSRLVRKPNQTNPCKEILIRYKELGGEILTIGSDAHLPENIACGFETVSSLLKDCGFTYYTSFEKRHPSFHKL